MIKQSTIDDIKSFFSDHGFSVSVTEQCDLICILCIFSNLQSSLSAIDKNTYVKANKKRRIEMLTNVYADFSRLKREIEAQAYRDAKNYNTPDKIEDKKEPNWFSKFIGFICTYELF